jgi:hypothetical protein
MKTTLKKLCSIALFTLFIGESAFAQTASSNPSVIADTVNLINMAGKQRMLSQRIAKDYL